MHEAAGHSASAVENREMNAGAQVALFFSFFSLSILFRTHGMMLPKFRVTLATLTKVLWKGPHRCTQRSISNMILCAVSGQ